MFVQMVKHALPGAFMNRRFHMVCFVIGHTVVSVVQNSTVYKINDELVHSGSRPCLVSPRKGLWLSCKSLSSFNKIRSFACTH